MAAGGSRKVVVLALLANSGIGVAKLVAALATSSGAMLAEAIHSFADSGNQGLLLLGAGRAAKPADEKHPLGYGREAYFWAMLVAVILFALGGLFSLYEGVHKLQHPAPIKNVGWAVGVLLFSLVLEGGSMAAAWKQFRLTSGGRKLFAWAAVTGDVDLLVVVFEDIAATVGLAFALIAILLTHFTGNPAFDAIGTCVIGVLLLIVAVFVASQVRRLIVGFSADAAVRDGITGIWKEHGFDVLRLISVWVGPGRVMVAAKINLGEGGGDGSELVSRINVAEDAVRAAYPTVAYQFIEPDVEA